MNLIDFNELDKLYDGDQKFQREIITSFVKRIPDYFDCLNASLHQDDTENLLIYTCQLRAIAKRCCVNEIHGLCLVLEEQIKGDKFASATVTLRQMQSLINRVQTEYLGYIAL